MEIPGGKNRKRNRRASASKTPKKVSSFDGYAQKCKLCRKSKSANEFKDWTTQGRLMKSDTCVDCRNGMTASAAEVNREVARSTIHKKITSALRKDRIDVPHVSELAGEFIRQYGGLEQYVMEMKSDIDEVRTNNPGDPRILQSMNLLNRLIMASTQLRESAPDMVEMSDEDVDAEIERLLDERLGVHRPEDDDYEDDEEATDGPGMDTRIA